MLVTVTVRQPDSSIASADISATPTNRLTFGFLLLMALLMPRV
jgi:hypothetical protein